MSASNRPLSPHLQVYRLPLLAVLSISHRATGVALSVGSILIVWWLASAAAGADAFEDANALLGSIFGRLVLFGFVFALFFHMCNGVRHLFWDAGRGYELDAAYRSGYAVLGLAGALTLVTFIAGWAFA